MVVGGKDISRNLSDLSHPAINKLIRTVKRPLALVSVSKIMLVVLRGTTRFGTIE